MGKKVIYQEIAGTRPKPEREFAFPVDIRRPWDRPECLTDSDGLVFPRPHSQGDGQFE
jgi:hypothetical protein